MGELAREHDWTWEIRLSTNPDAELKQTDSIVVSTDSVILDACPQWANLGTELILACIPDARVVVLA
jgi:hypothetical protein